MSDKIFVKDITLPIIETGEDETYSFVQTDADLDTAGDAADAKKTGDEITQLKEDFTELDETAARIDGSYDTMTVGNAKQLTSNVGINDKAPYLFRTAGGANDIGDREEDTIVGGSVVWNQLASLDAAKWGGSRMSITSNGTAVTLTPTSGTSIKYVSCVVTPNHKYLATGIFVYSLSNYDIYYGIWRTGSTNDYVVRDNVSYDTATEDVKFCRIFDAGDLGERFRFQMSTSATTENYAVIDKPQLIDLTAMFGSTIADYIYGLETATTGAGVAWLKKYLPLDSYIPYCEPTIKSVSGLVSHNMTGFNQWNEVWEIGGINNSGENESGTNRIRSKNYIPVVPSAQYYVNFTDTGFNFYARLYDADKNFIGTIPYFGHPSIITMPDNANYLRFFVYKSGWSSGYGTDLLININLHWDGERDGEYEAYNVNSYPLDDSLTLMGIPKLDAGNNLYYDGDTYEADGTVTRRYKVVDLGTLTWSLDSDLFYCVLSDRFVNGVQGAGLCDKYAFYGRKTWGTFVSTLPDKQFGFTTDSAQKYLVVKDTAYDNVSDFTTAINGFLLVYELATPTTETADPFQTPQVVDDWGTEEYVCTPDSDGVVIPVGHDTFYSANLKAKLEMSPDSPGDGDGDYIVRQTNGLNEYAKLVIPAELPTSPSEDGAYTLKVTVSDGTATLAWVADT